MVFGLKTGPAHPLPALALLPSPLRVGREKGENPQAIKVLGPHPIYLIILFVKSFRILKTEGGQRRMGGG